MGRPLSPHTSVVIGKVTIGDLVEVLKAVADPARLRLLSLLVAAGDEEVRVGDLVAPVGLSQPTVSHHLRILCDSGLVEMEKRGVFTYCSIVDGALEPLVSSLMTFKTAVPRQRRRAR